MKVFEINSVPYGSTGRIMFQIADKVKEQGGTAITSCSYTKSRGIEFPNNFYQIGNAIGKLLHIQLAKITGRHGCYSSYATKKLIKKIIKEDPDVIHIHNLHGWFINIQMFFGYLKVCNKPVVWTLHDCWAFTGHCPHFTAIGCEKWKTGCFTCSLYKEYPGCFIDDSKKQYDLKKQSFTGVPNLTIVTPSRWLSDLVKQSYLKEYNTVVINNGIDLDKFKPTISNLREKYKLQNKIILLGVAFYWSKRKGIHVFEKLGKELDDKYQLILVGLMNSKEKNLPKNIIQIPSTQNQMELAEIYSAADVLINPTLEDNFPTVNIEALACGTPVITFKTGGSPEAIGDGCGWVVPYGDYEELKNVVNSIRKKTKKMIKKCANRGKIYGKEEKYLDYIKLFNAVAGVKKDVF